MPYRLGVDVGGTFTDLLLIDELSGATFRDKVPSTPADPSQGVLQGIQQICRGAGIDPSDIVHLMHGTTVATNAILEAKGARVGLLTTDGYRQVLQVARSYVPGGLAAWIVWPKPTPLALLEDTIEIRERIGARGEILRELDEDQVREALGALAARGIEALTVAFVNSYVNAVHERRVGELAAQLVPEIPVSLSSEILPEIREYERTITTVANSYVRPTVGRYVSNLEAAVRGLGVQGQLWVLRSDGGLTGFASARDAPVALLMSGPAGGVAGAVWAAGQAGFSNLLTFDMGGTSTDVCLVEGGIPRIARDTEVGDLNVRVPSVDVRTVGAGGGSIAHVPELTRALRVGPDSAGADPGPAAYGRGGELPTVTDANVVLGFLPPQLLGGQMALDVERAERAVQGIATAMNLPDVQAAAAGIVDIVNESIVGALRLVSVQQGYDPRDFALVAFGGAGPLHANAIAHLMGSWPVIIPPSPGVLCAYGEATTVLRHESARTFIRRFGDTTEAEILAVVRDLGAQASQRLEREGIPVDEQVLTYQADVRYQGQGFEVPVDIDLVEFGTPGYGLSQLAQWFHAEHRRMFLFSAETEPELVNVRAIARSQPLLVAAPTLQAGDPDPAAALVDSTTVYISGRDVKAHVYERSRLLAGNVIEGPAIIVEMDSTTLVLPGHTALVDPIGNLVIRPA